MVDGILGIVEGIFGIVDGIFRIVVITVFLMHCPLSKSYPSLHDRHLVSVSSIDKSEHVLQVLWQLVMHEFEFEGSI